jgi:hypothetical protein
MPPDTSDRRSLLRHSDSTVVETDMRPFDGALNEDWCHFTNVPGMGNCGCRPNPAVPLHFDRGPIDGRCTGCGRRKCPDCLA